MSQNRLPSSSEVIGWTPEKLAEFLRKRNLQGCDRVVLLNRITGERFVNLTNNDLDKFPKTYNPLISKLISDIHKQKSGKRRFFPFGQSKNPQPVETETDDVGWGREEFDDSDDGDEFDDDYEEPENEEDDVGDYEDPSEDLEPTQVQTRYQSQTQDQEQDSDYEPPPSEPDDFSHKLPCAPVGDGDYIDSHMSSRGPPPALCPRPPVSTPHRTTRRDVSPRPPTGPKHAGKLPPPVCRVNKPGRDAGSSSSPIRGASRNTVEKPLPPQTWSRTQDPPEAQSWTKPSGLSPTQTSVSRSNSGARAPPQRFEVRREQQPLPNEDLKRNTFPLQNKSGRPGLPPARHTDSLPPGFPLAPQKHFSGGPPAPERPTFKPPPPSSTQDLDPLWYVGNVTRAEAEALLKELGKDGAFIVRDSSRQSAVQPYTLMVQYQNKVYNIQIQNQDRKYLLGTGIKVQESFLSVREIVEHFSQSPLLLIDSKNRGSSQQNQCLLSVPAGPYVDRV
ncbi:lymphocyte cytosolic protein 2a [Periophthalmus magnuspinnatus]|uniref:lymphocyte cytosolic protein 2a n=1 Tax=Periophthalmus magnuspinnatus TaxID=409849 RepID=UPI00145ACED8|nr:lymphocyte cytosolic protein 2a [Periophthalmus magnuspinnatus]